MDQRIRLLRVTDTSGRITALGRTYTSEAEAESKIPLHIAYLEKLAKRKLTGAELLQGGIDKPETRSKEQIIEDNRWQPVLHRPPVDPNVWVARKDEIAETIEAVFEDGKRESRKALFRRASDQEQQRLDAEDAADADAERRALAISQAKANLEKQKFSATATRGDVVRAEQLLEQAEKGKLSHYRVMAAEITEAENEKYGQLQYEHSMKVADMLSQLDAEKPVPIFEDSPPAGRSQVVVQRMYQAGGSVVYQMLDGNRVVKEWDAGSTPREIVEAVQ